MDLKNAINLIENALEMANQKGVFNLQDSATVFAAMIVVKKTLQPEAAETVSEEESK